MTEDSTIQQLAESVDHINCRHCGKPLDVSGLPLFSQIKCPHCKKDLRVPGKLGDFFLLEQLGRGGMATVYKALDPTLNREVAIKVMRRELGDDPKFVENFLREARLAAQINHPNIVQIYQCGKRHEQPYIVMELVSGGKLDELINKEGKQFSEKRALKIGLDAAKGLLAAHEIGLVHGDIKPANILFGRGGLSKVADFGLAQFAHKDRKASGEIWGTPYYIAPEKARRQPEDLRSDIYSLGATLFHALTGEPPFDGETAKDVVLARLKGPPPDIEEIRPDLRPMTVNVVKRMLEADPVRRYPNYKSLIGDLNAALQEFSAVYEKKTSSTQIMVDSSIRKRKPQSTTSSAGPLIAVFVVALLLLAGLVGYIIYKANQSKEPVEAKKPSRGKMYRAPDRYEEPETTEPAPGDEETATASAAVSTGETAEAVSDTHAVAEAEEPEPVKVYPIQPLSEEQDRQLAAMLKNWAASRRLLKAGDLMSLQRQLRDMAERIEETHPARDWLKLLDAMTAALQKDDARVQAYVRYFEDAVFTSPEPDSVHPSILPARLVAYFKGSKPQLQPPQGLDHWPSWFLDAAEFMEAAAALSDGRFDQTRRSLKNYKERKPSGDATWPYAMAEAADTITAGIDAWEQLKAKMESRVAQGDHASVISTLRPVQRQASPVFAPYIETLIARSEKAIEEERKARELAEQKAREAKIQAELEVLEKWDRLYANRVQTKDVRAALRALERQEDRFETETAKKTYEQYLAECRVIQGVLDFLIAAVNQESYTPIRGEFAGRIEGANNLGINLVLGGGVGMSEIRWKDVSAPQIYQLMRHYLSRKGIDRQAAAEGWYNLAVYTDMAGGRKPALGALRQAMRLDESLMSKLNQYRPELAQAYEEAVAATQTAASPEPAPASGAAPSGSGSDGNRQAGFGDVQERAIGDIDKSMIGQTISTRGEVISVRSIRGGNVLVLSDKGRIEVLIWERDVDEETMKQIKKKGAPLIVRGELQEYRNTLQIMPGSGKDIIIDSSGGGGKTETDESPAEGGADTEGAPSPPANVAAEGAPGTIVLTWDDNPEGDVVRYQISRSEDASQTPKYIGASRESTYTDKKVKAGVAFYYVIRAVDKEKKMSAPSEMVSATPREAGE